MKRDRRGPLDGFPSGRSVATVSAPATILMLACLGLRGAATHLPLPRSQSGLCAGSRVKPPCFPGSTRPPTHKPEFFLDLPLTRATPPRVMLATHSVLSFQSRTAAPPLPQPTRSLHFSPPLRGSAATWSCGAMQDLRVSASALRLRCSPPLRRQRVPVRGSSHPGSVVPAALLGLRALAKARPPRPVGAPAPHPSGSFPKGPSH